MVFPFSVEFIDRATAILKEAPMNLNHFSFLKLVKYAMDQMESSGIDL